VDKKPVNAPLTGGTVQEISFSNIPILAGLDKINLARLIPNFEQLRVRSGEIILKHGDPWNALYIINEGIVRVFLPSEGKSREIACLGPGDCFGEMALLTGEPGSANIEAMTDLSLLMLSKECFDQLISKHHSLGVNLAGLLASRLSLTYGVVSGHREVSVPEKPSREFSEGKLSIASVIPKSTTLLLPSVGFLGDKRVLSLLLAAAVCVVTGLFLRSISFGQSHIILVELLLAASIIWGLNLFSYHVVSLALPVLAVLFGVTNPAKALSGFSSPSWFLVLGVFAISAAISKTGLLYRLVLLIIRRFPPSYLGQSFGLTFSGLLLTPVIPSTSGRVILASPLVLTLSEILGFKKGSAGAIGLAMGCLLGFGHMSFMFMNGTASCFLVLGLIPPEASSAITWGYWFKIAFPMGIVFFLFSYLSIIVLHRPKAMVRLNSFVTEAQLKTLGPMTTQEKISLATVVVSLAGFMTQPWHKIDVAWVAMLSFLILFASSVLDEKAVRSDIDWNSLVSFGALVSFANIISETGLITIIANGIKPYTELLARNQPVFLLSVALAMHLLRFVLPLQPALLISVLSVMPILSTLGIHPLVVGLIALASGNPWFLPYQDIMYQNLTEVTEGKLFSHEQTMRLAFIRFLIILVAITISIPFWKQWNLMP
jgi:branched-chain amino acid transport system substrate-binding protein